MLESFFVCCDDVGFELMSSAIWWKNVRVFRIFSVPPVV